MPFFRWLRRGASKPPPDRPTVERDPEPLTIAEASTAATSAGAASAVPVSRGEREVSAPPIPQYIFVSYAHSDEAFASRLSEALRSRHFALWIDTSGITPGAPDYEQVIRDVIPTAFALVLIGSPAASTSVNVRGEVAKARADGCPIVPVWSVGDQWVDSAPLALSDAQYIDCRGERYDEGLARLVATLRDIVDQRAPKQTPVTTFKLRDYSSVKAAMPPGYIVGELSDTEGALVAPGYMLVETRKGSYIGVRPSAYTSFAALLHDLYATHLESQFPPFTYGRAWTLAAGRPHDHPSPYVRQVLLPFEWMGATDNAVELTALATTQSASSLARMGIVAGSYWQVEPRAPEAADVIGLATNRQDIAELVIASSSVGPRAQHPKGATMTLGSILSREGRGHTVERLPIERLDSDAYAYTFILERLSFPLQARELQGQALLVS
jgi:TIR domain